MDTYYGVYPLDRIIRVRYSFVIAILMLILLTGAACNHKKIKATAKDVLANNSCFDRRYLAMDQTLHGELRNIKMVMGQARNQQVIFEQFDDAWEMKYNLFPVWAGSIIRDHEGRLRMYYVLRADIDSGYVQATALAFSDDGVNWTKPPLNIAKALVDNPLCNLINLEPHPDMKWGHWYNDGHAFYDENASLESRYKLAWRIADKIYVATSSDGLNFVTQGKAFNYKADTHHSFFYDPLKGEYVMYGRKRGDWETGDKDRRGIPRHSSKNWTDLPWTNVGQVVIDPMDVWDYSKRVRPQVYTPAIQIYHGQYIGMPSIFFVDEDRQPVPRPDRKTGTFYPMVMYSHDGIHWRFPDLHHPIIELEPHERISTYELASFKGKEVGMICSASNFLEIDDRLLVYYVVREQNHYEPCPPNRHSLHVAFMRLDGFASLQTQTNEPGEWITSDLKVPLKAGNLQVNADVTGRLRVEVLDAATGKPVNGLRLANSVAFTGDKTNFIMKWKGGDLKKAAGRDVRLRFIIEDGRIYSFSFKP